MSLDWAGCHVVTRPFLSGRVGSGYETKGREKVVSSPDPTYERGSGDIQLIPRVSLMLITFQRSFSQPITLQSVVQH